VRDLFARDWLTALNRLRRDPRRYLRPGSYIAVLAEEPFVESGLDKAGEREGATVVYGRFAPAGDAESGVGR